MASTEDNEASDDTVQSISAAERIKELCTIDKSITRALTEAGLAIQVLSGRTSPTDTSQDAHDDSGQSTSLSLDEAKQSFQEHSTTFLSTLQTISAQLRRQVFALEEAGIITATNNPPEPSAPRPPRPVARNAAGPKPLGTREEAGMPITNGGLGNLDVGWLNSRRDEVARRKEAELWKEGKEVLRELLGKDVDAMDVQDAPQDVDDRKETGEVSNGAERGMADDGDDLIIED